MAHLRVFRAGGEAGGLGASRRKLARGDRRLRSCTGKIQEGFGCSFRRGGSSVHLTIRPDPSDANTAPRIPLLPHRDFSAKGCDAIQPFRPYMAVGCLLNVTRWIPLPFQIMNNFVISMIRFVGSRLRLRSFHARRAARQLSQGSLLLQLWI